MKNKTRDIINYLEQKYKLEFETDWDQECYYKCELLVEVDDKEEIFYFFNLYVESRYIDFYDEDGGYKLYFCYDDLEYDDCINKIENYLLKINYFKSINRNLKLEQLLED